MTERQPINLADVRALAEGPRGLNRQSYSIGAVNPDDLLALVEAVEAAHAYFPLPDHWSNGDERDKLRAALARFTFEDTP